MSGKEEEAQVTHYVGDACDGAHLDVLPVVVLGWDAMGTWVHARCYLCGAPLGEDALKEPLEDVEEKPPPPPEPKKKAPIDDWLGTGSR